MTKFLKLSELHNNLTTKTSSKIKIYSIILTSKFGIEGTLNLITKLDFVSTKNLQQESFSEFIISSTFVQSKKFNREIFRMFFNARTKGGSIGATYNLPLFVEIFHSHGKLNL